MVGSVAIIGASAAGVSAARTLRDEGFAGSIVLIDADANGAYERPPLSKAVLVDVTKTPEDVALLSSDQAHDLNITCIYGHRCVDLNPDGVVTLEDGQSIAAEKVILATGGKARMLPISGADVQGVHVLRDFSDAEKLRTYIDKNKSIAVIGGGLIGSEVVASLTSQVANVCWIDAAPKPLIHILPEAIADPLIEWHVSCGVQLITDARIQAFLPDDTGRSLRAVQFTDGSEIPVDAAIVGVGMIPNADLAEGSGLDIEQGGVAVDQNQQTSAQNIYAVGDVAAVRQEDGSYVRHEHWQAAEHQGLNAARAIMGLEPMPDPIPWFWSDQADNHLEMVGHKGDRSVVRVVEDAWPVVFEFVGDKLVGAVSINNPTPVRVAQRLIKSGAAVSDQELSDPSVDLRKLMRR